MNGDGDGARLEYPSLPGYTIRPAEHEDLDRVTDLLLALQDHLEASNRDLWRMDGEARANLKGITAGRLTAPNGCALVAEHEADGVVGVIFGRVVTNSRYDPPRAGSIDQAYVRPDHRRRGVATRLVAAVCDYFAAEGVQDLSLRYVAGNEEAAGFWAARGFAPRIITAGAPRGLVQRLARPANAGLPSFFSL
ncbi:MAG: GNAT family N-acetyltransferase [Anaerolineae bacterium]|nr:GNAT family N-acetyltransferase [Anaerolineae bacterium]